MLVAIPTLGELYGGPGLLIYLFTGSVTLALIGAALGGALLVLFIVPLFTVRQLTVDTDGLYFQRVFGAPKSLPWSQVRRIAPATRGEIILWGWLLPPFPSHEPTRCMSSRDQFRIEWGRRYCYFPPSEPERFVAAVSRWYSLDEGTNRPASPDETPDNTTLPAPLETDNPYQPPQTMP